MGTGLAYLVNDADYGDHLEETAGLTTVEDVRAPPFLDFVLTSVEVTTCGSDLHAVNQAYTRNSKGYLVTGVVAVSCRHSFVRPTGVVDLQKGEK